MDDNIFLDSFYFVNELGTPSVKCTDIRSNTATDKVDSKT